MISRDDLIAIERSLWKNDAVIYETSLTPDAVLVFAETGPITRGQAVTAIREENAAGRRCAGPLALSAASLFRDEIRHRLKPPLRLVRFLAKRPGRSPLPAI